MSEPTKTEWSRITDNKDVIKLLKQRDELEDRITELDGLALINYEIYKLSL